jgi:hypothetical protein
MVRACAQFILIGLILIGYLRMNERIASAVIVGVFCFVLDIVISVFVRKKKANPAQYDIAFLHPHWYARVQRHTDMH